MSIETNEKYSEIEDLLTNLVCKEEMKARSFSTADTDYSFSLYSSAVKQKDFLEDYEIPLPLFHEIVPRIPIALAELIISGKEDYRKHLTSAEINSLLVRLRDVRIKEYVEQNDYYRMLLGLPPFKETEEDFIYYKGHPIHELPLDLFYECKYSGFLDVKMNEFPDKHYIWYIGKHINLIHAREADQFEILYTKNGSAYNKYRECFNKEREVFMRTIHSDHLCSTTDYAEVRELVTIKFQSVILYKLETNSSELDKAEFSVEEATRIWKEFGLSYPKNMIESYRNTTTFLLNYLVSMKGTNNVMSYISEKLFTGIKLYKYIIRKTHKQGLVYPLPEDTDPQDFYNIEFVLRPFYATNIDDYKETALDDKILTYDEVVAMDPKWRDSEELKKAVFSSEFSYCESKYLSLDNFVDLSEFTNTFSILSRILIEHKSIMETKKIIIPSVGREVDGFTMMIYYLALMTKFVEGKNVVVPDSIETAIKILGFKIPPNIDELRIRFAWFFAKSDYSWLLDAFPDAIDTNGSFFNFVVNTDKVIGLDSYMYDLLNDCKNWQEYELASNIFNLVKLVNRTPESYGVVPGEEITYADWLLKNAPDVFDSFKKSTEDHELFVIELDSLTQILIKFFESATEPDYHPSNITAVINTFAIMANGISKYLRYILNMFKAYSCEFLNESVAYYMDEKYNAIKQIDNIRMEGEYTIATFDNNSDWDGVIFVVDRSNTIFDSVSIENGVFISTPFGDIRINNQGG